MQLRFKIIIVFILSLIVSVVVFLSIFVILIATPFSGGYSEKDMNLAANAITEAISSLPDLNRRDLAPIFNKWQKKYPNMTFSITMDSKVLFTTAKKIDSIGTGFVPDQLLKIVKSPTPLPNELPAVKLPALEPQLQEKNKHLQQDKQIGLFTLRLRQQETTAKTAPPPSQIKQMIIINNPQSAASLKKNRLLLFTLQRTPTERILIRELKGPSKIPSFLLITVNSQFYTAIELFTDPQKAGVIITIFLIGLGFTIIFTSIFAIGFTRNISRRFNHLYSAIGSFELGNLNVQITDRTNDEIGRIAATFNGMTEKIRHQFKQEKAYHEQRRQLISDVSHDLRTPLTTIIGYTESLENGIYENEAERRNYTGIIRKKALYMEKLLGELLEFSRMESENFELQITEFDLAELTREILIEYLPLIKEQAIRLQANIPDSSVLVKADANRISRVIRNLIDNAMSYGSQGKYLGVAITVNEASVMINLEDHGPGISQTEQAKIFDRFYRVDKGRNSAKGGAGLGLAIAWEIVKKHGGQIRVSSEKGMATVFTVELPLY